MSGMGSIVMTLVVRDDVDVIDACLAYHFRRGVDLVIATDHRSADGTTDVLRRHERDGRLRLLREDGEAFDQAGWVTRMARMARAPPAIIAEIAPASAQAPTG